MSSGRCPICDSYSCRCSGSRLREYQSDHAFDHSPNVLRRWAQDDRNERVESELRDRRIREMEAEEERRRKEGQQRAEAERRRAEAQAEYYRQEEERERQQAEEDA